MQTPVLSAHFSSRNPSAIRMAQIEFSKRTDGVNVVNTAIGNISLPMHPAMQKRMFNLNHNESPFKDGVVKYTSTKGQTECNDAFLNIISSSGFETKNLYSQITDGGSQAMELVIVGTCGPAGSDTAPLLLIDAAYTNYNSLASRLGRKTVSVTRNLSENGKFSFPDITEIEKIIEKEKPGAMVIIPYDNPTGQFIDHDTMIDFAKLCVKFNMWMISDEAYRELFYSDEKPTSIWGLKESEVPGICGRRISIETASKIWNACGLRIGALITDNKLMNEKSVAENTANLCSNAIGQYIFGTLAHESSESLNEWYEKQRNYYYDMLKNFQSAMKEKLPGIIVSSPDASLYSVIDVRNIAKKEFNSMDFVMYCASKGVVDIDGKKYTLLISPMCGFYSVKEKKNPGKTQMRVAYVETPEKMELVPTLFSELFKKYENMR
ncbi:MAG: aminotransferase class I/II-fold pyridoxal phosphate-dependent enzyme [Bacteriovoracaceae bacterium]|nr:aminotransferase class I/II-fold pyridoxal phosphate-dependent enzyme [Bacteriovoracaceae bacterium]